jgi:kinesin family member 6/9
MEVGQRSLHCSGALRSEQQRGLIPRVLAQLFIDAAALTSKIITFHMSYIEIHNESLCDLLATSTSQGVTITDRLDQAILQGAAVVKLRDAKHAVDTFCRGEALRTKRGHALNGASSRSHAICMIHIEIRNDPGDPQALFHPFRHKTSFECLGRSVEFLHVVAANPSRFD